jgi:tetratricopeptide (TPR) repeat protein
MKRPESRVVRLKRINEASENGLPALTVARARDLLEDYPEDPTAWMFLGMALTELARFEEAEEALENAIVHCAPGARWSMLSEMGHMHKAKGAFKQAERYFRKVIAEVPDEATGYTFLGDILFYQGRLRESEGVFRRGTTCREGCMYEAYHNLGVALRAEERLVEAAECFAHVLEIKPDYEPAQDALRDVRAAIAFARKKGDAGRTS